VAVPQTQTVLPLAVLAIPQWASALLKPLRYRLERRDADLLTRTLPQLVSSNLKKKKKKF